MVFRSPKYYAELRKFRREQERKLQATSAKPQATSYKLPGPRPISNANKGLIHRSQAPSESSNKLQASSPKQKGSSFKPQASSAKIPEPGNN